MIRRLGQRFARFVTRVVVARPALWRVLRRPLVAMFDSLAPQWEESRVSPQHRLPLEAALAAIADPPARALDIGTGTGVGARTIAARFPDAAVVGVDASEPMILQARARAGSDRERYEVADSAALPFDDSEFDLVTLLNMIPFFGEVARVTADGGHVAIAFSRGAETPIFVPLDRVRAELEQRGFTHVANFSAGAGLALLARREGTA